MLAAELSDGGGMGALLDPGAPPADYAGREVRPGLQLMRIDPYTALAEYLGLQIGARGLVERLLKTRGFHQLLEASPGWRELITLGKLWHLEQMADARGPRFDLIVVDAPATGHGVAFLNVPRVVVSAMRSGPLRRHSLAVEELLEDPQRTLLLPVALAEELPTRETAELVSRVRQEVGIRVDRVVLNGVLPAPFPPGLDDLDARLARLDPDARFGSLPSVRVMRDCAAFLRARFELGRRYGRELGRTTNLPLIRLPYLADGVGGPRALAVLAEALLASPGAVA